MNDQTAIKILYTLHPFSHAMTAVTKRFRYRLYDQSGFKSIYWEYRFTFDCAALINDKTAIEIGADLYEHWT